MIGNFVVWGMVLLLFALVLSVTFLAAAKRYKRCPSDQILVIFGRVGRAKGSDSAAFARCIHGGAAFIWPLIQDYKYLELSPIAIDIPLNGALSRENIRVNAPSTFTVGISTDPGVMENAAIRLLGLQSTDVRNVAMDIIFGQFRATIATMAIEEINRDREKFQKAVMDNVEGELAKVGLRVINVNIKDITDESGYIEALGRNAAAEAINKAKIDVAEQVRRGETGEAEANKEKEVAVAQAKQLERIGVANANAEAVKGENLAANIEAESSAVLREAKAEYERMAITAEKIKQAEALREAYRAEREAESERLERDKASKLANTVPQAEADKRKAVIDAEALAERQSRQGEGEGDLVRNRMAGEAAGLKAKMLAEAEGIKARLLAQAEGAEAMLLKQAEGFARIVQAAGGDPNNAFKLLIVEKLPELVRLQTEAIRNLKVDKITVWDGGSNAGAGQAVQGLFKSLPPLHELCAMAGLDLPEYLGRPRREPERELEIEATAAAKPATPVER
ncbi:MAG: SPFH domain-containing protein [Pseudomonadota bacterium]